MKTKPLLLLLGLFLGSCTDYDYVPPPTAEGMACVRQCEMQQQQCGMVQAASLQQCEAMRNIAMISYNRCRALGGGTSCQMPSSCSDGERMCRRAHDRCFQACGGRIVEITR